MTWEGDFSETNSLSLVNARLYERLQTNERFELLRYPIAASEQVDVHITHQWPPRLTRPAQASYWIHILPWEFGAVPVAWYMPMKYEMDEIWVYSELNKTQYVDSGIPADKIRVLPLGVDPNVFYPGSVRMEGANPGGPFRFLYVGGTIVRKGFDILLDAYLTEFSSEDKVCLIVKDHGTTSHYNGITLQDRVLEAQKDSKSPSISYTDVHVKEKELVKLYQSCDCAVFPFRGEGFGLPIAEAAACGTAVIVPDAGPVTEWLDATEALFVKSSVYVHPEMKVGAMETVDAPSWIEVDKQALQQQLRYAYQHGHRLKEIGERASDKIRSRYSWDDSALLAAQYVLELCSREPMPALDEEQKIEQELELVAAYNHQKRNQRAAGTMAALTLHYSDRADLQLQKAWMLIADRKFLQALSILKSITEDQESKYSDVTDALLGRAWTLVAVCYCELQSWALAIEAFHKANELKTPIHALQISYFQYAIGTLKLLLGALHQELGDTYFALNVDGKAKLIYTQALELDPDAEEASQKLIELELRKEAARRRAAPVLEAHAQAMDSYEQSESPIQWHVLLHAYLSSSMLVQLQSALSSWFNRGQEAYMLEVSHPDMHPAPSLAAAQIVLLLRAGLGADHLKSWCRWCLAQCPPGSTLIICGVDGVEEEYEALCSLLDSGPWTMKGRGSIPSEEDEEYGYSVFQLDEVGIIWESPYYNASGYASEQRHFVKSLQPYPYCIQVRPIDSQLSQTEQSHERVENAHASLKHPALIHYQASPAHWFKTAQAPIQIGRTMFETDRIPSEWVPILNELTEVWVPSQFNVETFVRSGVHADHIQIIPGALDERLYRVTSSARGSIDGARSFTFLSVFDWSIRKGWDILLLSYLTSFTDEDDVSLVLKVSRLNEPRAQITSIVEEMIKQLQIKNPPHLHIIDTRLTEQQMRELYASCSAFVLPTRGEGWGRPFMEALAFEVPVIGTNWSAQLEFMNEDNSFLIEVERMVEITDSMPAHFHGHLWAEPSMEHLVQIMRQVHSDYASAKQRAITGRKSIFPKYSLESVGRLINRRLEQLIADYFRG
ncbi:glycosyltransferase [Paenibacillus sp. YYML68]|uniref:glycosyltransferase n=1 Tax=Paenibacillus sp. YYML68 TaxID=2909250 RepID=UPI00285282A2|nr:glycosyltransferase [Paenibacillus sp. YYML68]